MEMNQSNSDLEYNEQQISSAINVMRFPMLLLIVLIHCNMTYRSVSAEGSHVIADDIMNLVSECLCRGCVPLYFAISGYLFFCNVDRVNAKILTKKWHSRIYTLLQPYILWNILGMIVLVVIHSEVARPFFPGLGELDFNVSFVASCFWKVNEQYSFFETTGSPADSPMWYIRDWMVLNLLSPVIFLLVKKLKWWPVIALVCCFVGGVWVRVTTLTLTGILFYTVGVTVAVNKTNIYPDIAKLRLLPWLALGWSVVDVLRLYPSQFAHSVHAVTIVIVFLAMVNIGGRVTHNKSFLYMAKLGQLGFFIFAMHMLIAAEVKTAVWKIIAPTNNIAWIACYVANFVILTIVPAITYFTM